MNDKIHFIAEFLNKKDKTLSLAESFTGGKISSLITNYAGASNFFKGGVVVYSNESKTSVLGLSDFTINKLGVVSSKTAEKMAILVKKKFQTDYSIATTGNAGPNTSNNLTKVGEVYIAVAFPYGINIRRFHIDGNRKKVINDASNKSLEMLINVIKG
tara:strand:+ start:34073 stop:34546 length:474 start_codon:yes stop_codon:yes gene_type:complete